MKITLLHPSRGRAQQAFDNYKHWLTNSSGTIDIEHVISIDESDIQKQIYHNLFANSKIVCSDNDCVVKATNEAAKHATGDILIYLSDDFKCPGNWDIQLLLKFKDLLNRPMLIKVDDCLQPFEADVLTIPIMNIALYKKLGYFWNPIYRSMFCDQDLYYVCKNNSWLMFCPDLKFEHLHYCAGKAPRDETYMRSDSNWNSGKEIYAKRKLEGFTI